MRPTLAPTPTTRLRRLRRTPALRALAQENTFTVDQLIWPVFVREGANQREAVTSMPGVERLSVDLLVREVEKVAALGVPAVCIFPYTAAERRTEDCAEAWSHDNIANQAIRAIKQAVPDIAVMTDIALDPYNANGHDGLVKDGIILNDETIEALVKMALVQAECGADILGPSDMMDGRIGAIRAALESNGHKDVAIMSYAAKYASAFYGPFRDAVGASGRLVGDKKTYQMNPANSDEAMRLIERDLQEGADMVMVKPGQPYLDIIRRAKDMFGAPTYAYQVSGEYAMIKAAAQNGWIDEKKAMIESLMGFRRAGCDAVLTYFAPEMAKLLKNGEI